MISEAEYCAKVCGARCCYVRPQQVRCPNLTRCNSCAIYETRFAEGAPEEEVVGHLMFEGERVAPIVCSRIKKLLATPDFPADIKAGCCIEHPELLLKATDGIEESN